MWVPYFVWVNIQIQDDIFQRRIRMSNDWMSKRGITFYFTVTFSIYFSSFVLSVSASLNTGLEPHPGCYSTQVEYRSVIVLHGL